MSFCGDDETWKSNARYVVDTLKNHRAEFDMVACQGLSGQCIGFLAAYELGIPLVILRKTAGEEFSKRGPGLLEGYSLISRWKRLKRKSPRICFVDDCVSGGNTRKRVGVAVHEAGGVLTCQATANGFSQLTAIQKKSFERGSKTARMATYY